MRGQISALWVIRKVDFLKVARHSSSHRFYNALGVCGIFSKFDVCTMHGDLPLCGTQEKSTFKGCPKQVKPYVL